MRRLRIVFLIVVSFGCSKNPAQPSGHPILILGADMGNANQTIHLFRDDVPLTGARVRVNGTTIPEVSSGDYEGDLPAALAAGAQIRLEVRSGNDLVTGVTRVPTKPVFNQPVAGDVLHPGTPVAFSWTDATSPDEYQLAIDYVIGLSGYSARTTVGGSDRTGTVATTTIPSTAVDLYAQLFAYGNGTFTGPADPASRMHVRQQASRVSMVPEPGSPSAHLIRVSGADMGAFFENIDLSRDGVPLIGAQVKVNGTTIAELGGGSYRGQLPELLAPGAQLTITVTSGSDVVTGVAVIPTVPVLLAPVAGDSVRPGTPLAFSWTDSSNPDEFKLLLEYSGTGQVATVAGSARSGSVGTASVPSTASNLTASLFAYADGTFTGPADPASRMRVRQPAPTVPLVLIR